MNKLGGKFISPVFVISLAIFIVAGIAGGLSGGFGPCGPSNNWGYVWFICYPIGFLGILLGTVLSIIRICRHFLLGTDDKSEGDTNQP